MSDSQEVNETQPSNIIFASNDEPFKTRAAAKAAMSKQGFHDEEWEVIELTAAPSKEDPWGMKSDGFAIRKRKTRKLGEVDAEYYWVRFSAKSNPNDTDDVILSVNGETLLIRREKDVIIPKRFKECADHAKYPQYRQLPGMPRKVVAWVQFYPYQMLNPATESEFEEMKRLGNKTTAEAIKKYGFHYDPDTIEETA